MGKLNKQITKEQHFVPKFYLKRFADEKGFIEVLDLENRRIGGRRPFGSVCSDEYFYGIETGKFDEIGQEVEDFFKVLEDRLAPRYNKFVDKVINYEQVTDEDLYYASCVMSMLWIRSKYFRENINRIGKEMYKKINEMRASHQNFEEYMKNLIKERGAEKEISDEDIKLYKETLLSGDYDLKFSNKSHLLFLKEIQGFANLFFAKNWRAYFVPDDYRFITSDTPVSEQVPKTTDFLGAGFPDRNHYLALSPRVIIELVYSISGKKFKRKTINRADAVNFNLLRTSLSLEYCYGQRRDELEEMIRIAKYNNPLNRFTK
jgi:hypothetical protein